MKNARLEEDKNKENLIQDVRNLETKTKKNKRQKTNNAQLKV